MLQTLKISHYKGFYNEQKIEFSKPDGRKDGSGLTVIVGPNNTGKTTIIEALLLNEGTQSKRFKLADRHSEGGDPLIRIVDIDSNVRSFTNLHRGSALNVKMEHGADLNFQIELIPSRRFWQHNFSGQSDTSNLRSQSAQVENIRNFNDFPLGPTLQFILNNSQKRKRFNKYLKLFIPHFTHWTVDTDEGGDFIKYRAINSYHRANLLGDGIISLFRIVAHIIADDPNATFIIDEPELSLHPSAQKRLSQVISKLAKTKQIIVCTHSPYFVNWIDFLNGGNIIRLNKHRGKKCTVHNIDRTKNYSQFISTSVGEYQKPQLLDTVAKEILFTDKILFTEGQEDVGLIRNWLFRQNKIDQFDIFGYGVGGVTNMKLFLEMSKDLGLEKVAALYDNNSLSFTGDRTTYTKYNLKQLPTDDIRDKTDRNGNLITGVFTSKGRLKSRYKTSFNTLMKGFVKYFK